MICFILLEFADDIFSLTNETYSSTLSNPGVLSSKLDEMTKIESFVTPKQYKLEF